MTKTYALNINLNPSIYLFKNISLKPIIIDNYYHSGASAGFASYINPQRWSLLMLNRGEFMLSCTSILNKKLDCNQVIKTYRIKHSPNQNRGNFWITEDHNWLTFRIISILRGIWLSNFIFERIL